MDNIFTLWIGSPLPKMVEASVKSWRSHNSNVTLCLSMSDRHDSSSLEGLRRFGITIENFETYVKIDESIEKCMETTSQKLAFSKYGKFPFISDLWRYNVFARRSFSDVWIDADSICFRQIPSSLAGCFVATEKTRYAYPFRTFGLLGDTNNMYISNPELPIKKWFSLQNKPKLVTNSHLRLASSKAAKLCQDLLKLQNPKSDSGMTVLRKTITKDPSFLDIQILPAEVFNPIASWDFKSFEEWYNDSKKFPLETISLHVFSKVRRKLPHIFDKNSINWQTFRPAN